MSWAWQNRDTALPRRPWVCKKPWNRGSRTNGIINPVHLRTLAAMPSVKPWTAALLIFLLSMAASVTLVQVLQNHERSEAVARLSDLANDHAQAVQRALEQALAANYALAALVQQSGGNVSQFDAAGEMLLKFHPGVTMLGLGPGGRISQVIPLAGNERAIGFNPLEDPLQRDEALRARQAKQLSMAGPLKLVQGGVGVVGRLPVFLPDGTGQDSFWGFTNVTIRLDPVLELAQLPRLSERGFVYQLWRTVPDTGARQVIAESGQGLLDQPVERTIALPGAEWHLSVSPADGWTSPLNHLVRGLGATLISMLLAYLVYLLTRQRLQERWLETQVAARTAEIEAAQHHLQATLQAVPDPMFEFDLEGLCLGAQVPAYGAGVLHTELVVGKSLRETLDAEASQEVMSALEEAHRLGWSGGRLFVLQHEDGPREFELSVARSAVPAGATPRFVAVVRDVTRRQMDQEMLRLTAKVFELSSDAFVVTDAHERIIMVNQAFCTLTGFNRHEVLGKSAKLLAAHREDDRFVHLVRAAILEHGHWEGEAWNQRKDRSRYLQWLSVSSLVSPQGLTSHYIAAFRDITQQKQSEERIRSLAYFDPLTGLPNRTLLQERSQAALNTARRTSQGFAVLFLDIDHFKNVNDSLGHGVGDQLLLEFARRLHDLVTEPDTVARLGGDEFVLLIGQAQAPEAQKLAQAVLDLATEAFMAGGHELNVTLSIGVALFPQHGTDFQALQQRADAAMYRAKRSGRNQYCLFTEAIQADANRVLVLENALRRAQERGQLSLHYQPQLDLNTGAVVGAEALMRWNHPELGAVSPAEFIPVAEDTGLILGLGEWVLRTALNQLRQWLDQGLPPMTLAVNVSAVQFRQSQLPDLVKRLIEEAGVAPDLVGLELTEGVALEDPVGASHIMDRLHAQGIRLLIDDFGTGYSSLSQLKRFQVSTLKIDRSFIHDLQNNPEDRALVRAIISMAQALDMLTLAEGVENAWQMDFLRKEGCQEIQGFHFSRPLPASDFEHFVRRHHQSLTAASL